MRDKLTKIVRVATLGLALVFAFSCSSGDDTGGCKSSGCESDKGNDIANYKFKRIGDQVWMTENLNYKVSGSECYENKESNCDKYGRLYDWATAMGIDAKYNEIEWGGSDVKHHGICPSGWHIPSDADWGELISYVESYSVCSYCAGKRLKATSGWKGDGNGLDIHGFSALPGGIYESYGGFSQVGYVGIWWSSTNYDYESRIHARFLSIDYSLDNAYLDSHVGSGKSNLYSVRCIQD